MRRKIVFIGIILLAIGIMAMVFSLAPIPFTDQEQYERPMSLILLDESFTVPIGTTHRIVTLNEGDKINIDFRVTSGGNLDVNFYCKRGDYTVLSLYRAISFNNTVTIPNNGTYYFIWDNSFSVITTKTVFAKLQKLWNETAYRDVTKYYTVVPSEYVRITEYASIALVLTGIIVISWGIASKENSRLSSSV